MKKLCYYCMKPMNGEFCASCKRKAPTISSEKLLPGTILHEKYLVGFPVGSGGFGITYVGLDTSLQLKVAIKEFFPKDFVERNNAVSAAVECIHTDNYEKNVANSTMFQTEKSKVINEARTLAMFTKETSIVSVRDYFEENNTAYIVMEYLEGDTLEAYINHNGVISASAAYNILLPIMNVLSLLHQQNIIHRDVSPDNIMFEGSNLKLLDFGAAREVLYNSNKSVSVMVKNGFAPEEQYRKKGKIGAWTDIYSLCATIYFCITGQIPDNALDRRDADELKYPSVLGATITPQQEKALMYGLNVVAKDRCESIDEFIRVWNGGNIRKYNSEMETEGAVANAATGSSQNITSYGGEQKIVSQSDRYASKSSSHKNSVPPKKHSNKGASFIIATLCILVVCLTGGLIWMNSNKNEEKETPQHSSDTVKNDGSKDVVGDTTFVISEMSDSSVILSDSSVFSDKESSVIEETSTQTEEEIRNAQIQEYIYKANNYVDQGKYDEAIAVLDNATQLYGSDLTITNKKRDINKKKSIYTINEFKQSDDYKGAILYINGLSSELSLDNEIIEQKNLCITKYRNSVLSEAEEIFKTSGYTAAIDCLNESLEVIPDDPTVLAKIEGYKAYAPVSLEYITNTNGDDYSFEDSAEDPRGTVYNDVLLLESDWVGGWDHPILAGKVEFYTARKYSTFECTLFPNDDFSKSEKAKGGQLQIYADGKLVYTSETLSYKTNGIKISVNIGNAEYLTFKVVNNSYESRYCASMFLVDAVVKK